MPAGSSVWYCPLCNWVHAQPPPDRSLYAPANPDMVIGAYGPAYDAIAALPLDSGIEAVLSAWLAEAETAIEAHLPAHSLLEWVTEVVRLKDSEAAANRRGGEIVQHAPAILAALKLAEENAATAELARPYREALDATGWDKRL
jgi:hypothetical protein